MLEKCVLVVVPAGVRIRTKEPDKTISKLAQKGTHPKQVRVCAYDDEKYKEYEYNGSEWQFTREVDSPESKRIPYNYEGNIEDILKDKIIIDPPRKRKKEQEGE